jgi:hypothetical protein
LIESAKFNYEDAKKPEDDNTLFMLDSKNLDEDGDFISDGAVWSPI